MVEDDGGDDGNDDALVMMMVALRWLDGLQLMLNVNYNPLNDEFLSITDQMCQSYWIMWHL